MLKPEIEAFLTENEALLAGDGLVVVQTISGAKFIGVPLGVSTGILKIDRYKKVRQEPDSAAAVWQRRGYVVWIGTISIESIYAIEGTTAED